MGYSKIISLGQKIKLHKTHQKRATILNIDKNGLHPWAIAFAKSSVWVKK